MTNAESGAWPTGIRPGSLERFPGLGGRPRNPAALMVTTAKGPKPRIRQPGSRVRPQPPDRERRLEVATMARCFGATWLGIDPAAFDVVIED